MRRSLTPVQKERILERDDYVCAYCLGNATEVEHVVPFSYSGCDDEDNLVASCKECNRIASNFVFDNFDEKCEFIRTRRAGRKWTKRLRRMGPPICTDCKRTFIECNDGATMFLCPECANLEYAPERA